MCTQRQEGGQVAREVVDILTASVFLVRKEAASCAESKGRVEVLKVGEEHVL